MGVLDGLQKKNILIVDDDTWVRNSLSYYLKKKTRFVRAVENAERARDLLRQQPFDVVICERKLPGMGGLELLRVLHDICPRTCRILITEYATEDVTAQARKSGVEEVIEKPFSTQVIEHALERCLLHLPG